MVNIKCLIWDSWNVEHIKKHDLTVSKVEKALEDPQRRVKNGRSGRYLLLGRSGERLLALVIAKEGTEGSYYLVTARDMAKKERRIYRETNE